MSRIRPSWAKEAKKAMVDQELTVVRLAKEIGRPRQTVSSVMSGRIIMPDVQEAICKHLGVKLAS